MKLSAIVAGNGPSLAKIDYSRMPRGCAIFRANQFYLEDSYYLGRRVDYAFAAPGVLFEQLYTLRTLEYRGEYDIGDVVCSSFRLKYADFGRVVVEDFFHDVLEGHRFIERLKKFNEFLRYSEIFLNRRITSGIYMCAAATALGYKKIYLAGIDFYEGDDVYMYDIYKDNLMKVVPHLSTSRGKPYKGHGKDIDLEGLEFLAKHYDVKFFCLCPSSPLSDYLPLASQDNHEEFRPETKSDSALRDMLVPDYLAYSKRNSHLPKRLKVCRPGDEEGDRFWGYKAPLKNNVFYKVGRDLLRLPRDLASYIKGRFLLSKWEKEREAANALGGGGGGQRPAPYKPHKICAIRRRFQTHQAA